MRSITSRQAATVLLLAAGAGLLAGFWDEIDPWLRAILVVVTVVVALVALRPRAAAPDQAPSRVLDLIEKIVAEETHRPWEPSTAPWLPTGASPKPVLLLPAADYHLAEVVPLSRELAKRDIRSRVAIGPSPWERTRPALSAYSDLEIFELPDADVFSEDVSSVFVMKDTGSLGPLVQRCRELGIPTMGKVEGAQDFWDADTPEPRLPYRNLDLVLCQGRFDADALSDRETTIVGSTRLERLWWAPPVTAPEPLAVINLNFVYGVRTADRKLWLDTAIEGCQMAGVPYLISLHPAEKARIDSPFATTISASRLLTRATVLISRFSTMPFEAMARGVPFVYHNPHRETVKTFADPMGAFDTVASAGDLARTLRELEPGSDHRLRSQSLFAHHVDVDRARGSEERGAEAIAGRLGR
ncbi:MAG: hypothetical protein ACRDZM_03355 [Acidimicrobiia bacterium]